jgi:hypothetical protein
MLSNRAINRRQNINGGKVYQHNKLPAAENIVPAVTAKKKLQVASSEK